MQMPDAGTVVQREEKSSTEIVEPQDDRLLRADPPHIDATPLTPAASPRAPTRRQKRDEVEPRLPPAVPFAGTPGSRPRPLATTPEELARKLSELVEVSAFAVMFDNARVEDCDTASEVLELLADGDEILGVDAVLRSGKKVVLYRKAGTDY